MRVARETKKMLEAARRRHGASGRPFGELHELALLEELDARQDTWERDGGPLVALPRGEILGLLEDLGWRAGYDEAASGLFFGADGTDSYAERVDAEGEIAHLGGFVFDAPDGSRYVLSCSAWIRPGGEEGAGARGRGGGALGRFARRVVRSAPFGSARPRGAGARWYMERADSYVVEPRFLYEEITILDLGPGGLRELYPIADSGRRVDPHAGTVSFRGSEEAIEFRARLEEALGARGILCAPRVVLQRAGLPVLPRGVREEGSGRRRSDTDRTVPREGDFEAARMSSVFLAGHVVRRGVSVLVPEQEEAEFLAERASWLSVAASHRDEISRRVGDGRIPEQRRRVLREELVAAEDEVKLALASLEDRTEALCGTLLSLLSERKGRSFDDAVLRVERESRTPGGSG